MNGNRGSDLKRKFQQLTVTRFSSKVSEFLNRVRHASCFADFIFRLRFGTPILMAALAAPTAGWAATGLTLANQGKSRYQIVLPTNALPSERYAAEELQKYFEKINDAKLPIVTDQSPPSSHEILLGDNQRLQKLG